MLLKEFLYVDGQVLGCIGASTVERVAEKVLGDTTAERSADNEN
jgi:hypothetical protein